MSRWLILVLSLGLFSAVAVVLLFRGPPRSADPANEIPGLQRETLQVGREIFEYFVYKPSELPERGERSALFVFHGGEGDGRKVARQTALIPIAERRNVLLVFPTAGGDHWNDGRGTTASEADDPAFITELVDRVHNVRGVNPEQIFATGASNGGMFTMRLACQRTGLFRAYATAVANLPRELVSVCQPERPVPLVMMNGTEDRLMPWNGGEIPSIDFLGIGAGGQVISTPGTVKFWREANDCSNEKNSTRLPDRHSDGTKVIRKHWAQCSGESEVVMYEIRGGGHGWPGSRRTGRPGVGGKNTMEIKASEIVVDFFSRYGL